MLALYKKKQKRELKKSALLFAFDERETYARKRKKFVSFLSLYKKTTYSFRLLLCVFIYQQCANAHIHMCTDLIVFYHHYNQHHHTASITTKRRREWKGREKERERQRREREKNEKRKRERENKKENAETALSTI